MPLAHIRGPGHPDALCDAMAIALVEEYLRRDPASRLQISVTGGRESLFVDGDLVSTADFDPAPVLRRVLSEVDPLLSAEPFLTCEPVQAHFLPACASFEPWIVYGYATAETPDFLPPAQHAARTFAHVLERFRAMDPNGFILGADYDLVADDTSSELMVRMDHAEHIASQAIEQTLQALMQQALPQWSLRLMGSASVKEAGLRRRSGVSGRVSAYDGYSSHIPSSASGVGYALRHPGNLGTWLAHSEAKRLVKEGAGRGVLLVLQWNPFETRPRLVSARNERGEDLSKRCSVEAFDLTAEHPEWVKEGMLIKKFRSVWSEE